MNDTRGLPKKHVGTSCALYVRAQVSVWRPDDFFALGMQMLDDLEANTGRDHPVGTRFDGSAGIGVDHHRAVGMFVAEFRKFVRWAAQIERTLGFQFRHQHAFFRVEDFRSLAHKAYAAHHHCLCGMVSAKARHFQRVRDATTCFFSQILQIRMHIIVRNEHCVLFLEQTLDAALQFDAFGGRWLGEDFRPGRARRNLHALGDPYRQIKVDLDGGLCGHGVYKVVIRLRCSDGDIYPPSTRHST